MVDCLWRLRPCLSLQSLWSVLIPFVSLFSTCPSALHLESFSSVWRQPRATFPCCGFCSFRLQCRSHSQHWVWVPCILRFSKLFPFFSYFMENSKQTFPYIVLFSRAISRSLLFRHRPENWQEASPSGLALCPRHNN